MSLFLMCVKNLCIETRLFSPVSGLHVDRVIDLIKSVLLNPKVGLEMIA